MLVDFLRSHRAQIEALAGFWLASGAATFELWEEEQLLVCWPAGGAPDPDKKLVGLLRVSGINQGRLHVTGLDALHYADRLNADAALLSKLCEAENDIESMTAAMVESQDQLVALEELGRLIRSRLDIETFSDKLLHLVRRLIGAYSALFLLQAPGYAELSLCLPLKQEHLASYGMTWFEQLKQEKKPLFLQAAKLPDGFPPEVTHVILYPMEMRDKVVGMLGVMLTVPAQAVSPVLKLFQMVAEQTEGFIENALFHMESIYQTRLNTTLELARDIQIQLLPRQLPKIPGVELAGFAEPAQMVGGDFYDVIPLSDQQVLLVIGDVAGKGMPAALMMATTRQVIRSAVAFMDAPDPAGVLGFSTQALYDDFTSVGLFATIFIAKYDPVERLLTYANAGHSPVMYFVAGVEAKILEADGPAMGVLPFSLSENHQIKLMPGDVLLLATDGLNEAHNADGELFGYDRLSQALVEAADRSAPDIIQIILSGVNQFAAGQEQADDQTILIVKAEKV